MRIAAIVHQFPPRFETGTEILCLRTMQALLARGHEVCVFAADPLQAAGGSVASEMVGGVQVVRIPSRRPRRLSLSRRMVDEFDNPEAAERLLVSVRSFGPDVIHVFQMLQFGLTALPRLKLIAPLVGTATDFHLVCPLVTGMLEDGSACGGPGPDGAICVSHYRSREAIQLDGAHGRRRAALSARGWLRKALRLDTPSGMAHAMTRRLEAAQAARAAFTIAMIGPPRFFEMLPDRGSPNLERLGHAAPPLNVPSRPVGAILTVAYFSSLAHHKGLHVLLDAIALIPAEAPLRFVVCGPPGPDAAYARDQQTRAERDPRIDFRTGVPHSEMAHEMSAADIVVIPSLWDENEPLVLLDALEAGRYAVVSDKPGLTRVLPKGGGETFAAGDAPALAELLRRLAADAEPVRAARDHPSRVSSFPGFVDQIERRYAQARKTLAEVAS